MSAVFRILKSRQFPNSEFEFYAGVRATDIQLGKRLAKRIAVIELPFQIAVAELQIQIFKLVTQPGECLPGEIGIARADVEVIIKVPVPGEAGLPLHADDPVPRAARLRHMKAGQSTA